VGRSWTVDLPISAFRSLQPKLYPGAQDLEVIDIYALTLRENAGLEPHQVEVLPGEVRRGGGGGSQPIPTPVPAGMLRMGQGVW